MQIVKTTVDHGPMHVVEFHGQGGEEIQIRLHRRSAYDDNETLIDVAKVMMLHAAAFDQPLDDSDSHHFPQEKHLTEILPAASIAGRGATAMGEPIQVRQELSDAHNETDDPIDLQGKP